MNQNSGLKPENAIKNRSEDIVPSNTDSLVFNFHSTTKFHKNILLIVIDCCIFGINSCE